MKTTEKLVHLMDKMEIKPDVFISASAIGFYGTSENAMFTEQTTKPGNDFLADVVTKWENVANQANKLGIRTVNARFGVILEADGGALPMMRLPVKLFAGGKIGTGEQWMSWIHIKDVARLIIFCINNKQVTGPINITSPSPIRNKDFMKILANIIKRPYYFRTPAAIIQIVTGEMSILITEGQYVLPQKALDHNFEFLYQDLRSALQEIHSK